MVSEVGVLGTDLIRSYCDVFWNKYLHTDDLIRTEILR